MVLNQEPPPVNRTIGNRNKWQLKSSFGHSNKLASLNSLIFFSGTGCGTRSANNIQIITSATLCRMEISIFISRPELCCRRRDPISAGHRIVFFAGPRHQTPVDRIPLSGQPKNSKLPLFLKLNPIPHFSAVLCHHWNLSHLSIHGFQFSMICTLSRRWN